MNAERLLAHYEKIAVAPDAIPRLRRLILDLAVRGKLVPQDANDESASDLLKRIAKEKARLVKAGEIKRENPVARASAGDLGFDLPAGWSATSLSEVAICLDYRRIPINSAEREARIAGKSQEELFPYYGATQQQGWIDDYLFEGEFILLGEDGVPFDDPLRTKAYLVTGKSWVNNHAHVFQGILTLPRFLVHYLNVFDYTGRVVGATRAKLNQAQAVTIPVPLPPLGEQHRIVAKVDELMGLCDRLEAARQTREATRDRLAAASLARLNAPDPETFEADARFALDALPTLTARPDQIKQLRQTILNLAARGKLVPQDSGDEPASELLKRIAKEKARLVKAGAIPAKKEPFRDPSRLTDELPASWSPIALGNVCNLVTSGSRGWAEFYSTSGPGFIRAQNIRFGKLRLDDMAFVNPPSNSEGSRTQVAKGDLLIVITGAGVTNPALLDHDPGEAYVSQHVGLVRPSDQRLSAWMLLCLMADAGGRAELVERAYGAGKPGLNLDNIRSLSIPVPPLAEQHRIVAKVDDLMALCDRLEVSLAATAATRRRLLEALLAEALAPADAREMEAAE